ncbi:MAG: hypothetical protein ACOC9P_02790 [bacterium]
MMIVVVRIATHQQPDADTLVAAWLASRFLFAQDHCRVEFVPRKWRPGERVDFDCVLDVGCTYEIDRLWFDHKPPAVTDRHRTCTSRQVWEYLLAAGHRVQHLAELIDAVHDGDSSRRRGSAAYRRSRREGLHGVYHRKRDGQCGDRELWRSIQAWLDRHDRSARRASPAWSSRWQRYGRGCVYLQALEAADTTGTFDARIFKRPHQNRIALKDPWDPHWKIADHLAEHWEVTRTVVREDAYFAFHMTSIINHCGDEVRVPILSEQWRLRDSEIGEISHSAGERQRFEISEVKAGRRPFRDKVTDVFDTYSFQEVISRLWRAEGSIRNGVAQLNRAPIAERQWAEPLLENLAALCQQLPDAIQRPEDANERLKQLSRKDTDALCPRKSVPPTYRTLRGKFASASALLKKNGRDVVRLPTSAQPCPDQVEIATEYLQKIQAHLQEAG